MTSARFRRMAPALPDVIEGAHQGHADFRAGKRIFATLGYPDRDLMAAESDHYRSDTSRAVLRWILAAVYAAAGLAHLWAPEKLLAITPSWVPFAPQVIFVTGLCEIAGAVALITKPLRWWAGIALAAYALCVWPANFKHAIDGIELPYFGSSWLYHGPRLAFQPVLIWWALYGADVIDWPWRRAKPSPSA